MLSFVAMRSIGTQSSGDFALPTPATQSVVGAGAPGHATADGAKAAKPAPPPTPKLHDVPPAVANALASGKVVVLLFTEGGAADDVETAQHFRALGQLGGRVRPFRAGIKDVGRYAGIVADIGLSQAPSVVIVRPDLKVVPPIEGYVDTQYLLQRVKDQLR